MKHHTLAHPSTLSPTRARWDLVRCQLTEPTGLPTAQLPRRGRNAKGWHGWEVSAGKSAGKSVCWWRLWWRTLRLKAGLANVSPWLFWGLWVQHRVLAPCFQQPWGRRTEILREHSQALVGTGLPNTSRRNPICVLSGCQEKSPRLSYSLVREEGVKRYGECRVRAQPLGQHSLPSPATHGPDTPHRKQDTAQEG